MKIDITSEERDEMIRLLDNYLSETWVESRRTKNREYRTQLHHEEEVLRSLLGKMRQAAESGMASPAI